MSTPRAGIYGGGPLWQNPQAIPALQASGFTTLMAWAIHVDNSSGSVGDLAFNDVALVTSGQYSGPQQLLALNGIKDNSTIDQVLFSVGSGGTSDFGNIASIIGNYGTGPGTPLHESFSALRTTFPVIDGIDFDDEDDLDAGTIVAFGKMLIDIGFGITFCPYWNTPVWMESLQQLWDYKEGSVLGINLQCYSGGSGNDPGTWIAAVSEAMGSGFDAADFVSPGLWAWHGGSNSTPCSEGCCPDMMQATLAAWHKADDISSGWVWLLDEVLQYENSGGCNGQPMTLNAYAQAVLDGVS